MSRKIIAFILFPSLCFPPLPTPFCRIVAWGRQMFLPRNTNKRPRLHYSNPILEISIAIYNTAISILEILSRYIGCTILIRYKRDSLRYKRYSLLYTPRLRLYVMYKNEKGTLTKVTSTISALTITTFTMGTLTMATSTMLTSTKVTLTIATFTMAPLNTVT